MSNTPLTFLYLLLLASSLREISGYASRNGEVIIYKDTEGFYVEVDLAENASSPSKMTKMILSLANSQTVLPSGSCLSFDTYNCGDFKCSPGTFSLNTINYPSFSAAAKPATIEAILDYSNWILKTEAFLTQSCAGSSSLSGQKRGGLIGMGTENNAKNSYISSKVFSISLNKDLTGGKLLWKYDPSLAGSSSPTILSANSEWRVQLGDSSAKLNVGANSISLTGSLVFDINSDAIGFPLSIYKSTIQYLQSFKNMYCPDSIYLPKCTLYQSTAELPTLTIAIGSTSISIPPAIYSRPGDKSDTIILNLKAIGSEYTEKNYVSSSFQNSVILDANFMNYYYTVFDSTNNQIKLYARGSSSTTESSSGSRTWIWIAGFIIVVAVGILVYVSKAKSSVSSSKSFGRKENPFTDGNQKSIALVGLQV